VRAGGDFMHARLLLPSLWAAMLPVAVVMLPRQLGSLRARAPWLGAAAVLVWAIVCAASLRTRWDRGQGPHNITDERAYYVWEARTPHPIRGGDFAPFVFARNGQRLRHVADSLATVPENGTPHRFLVLSGGGDSQGRLALPLAEQVPNTVQLLVAGRNIGLTGFLAGPSVHLVDRHGIADPLAARLRLGRRGRPGHEKMLSDAWVAARFAAQVPPDAATMAARRTLASPPLADLVTAITAPLGPHRFLANLRLAPRLHRLRIPPDPIAAERVLRAGAP
jgi:arabinofuranosyltransferase